MRTSKKVGKSFESVHPPYSVNGGCGETEQPFVAHGFLSQAVSMIGFCIICAVRNMAAVVNARFPSAERRTRGAEVQRGLVECCLWTCPSGYGTYSSRWRFSSLRSVKISGGCFSAIEDCLIGIRSICAHRCERVAVPAAPTVTCQRTRRKFSLLQMRGGSRINCGLSSSLERWAT